MGDGGTVRVVRFAENAIIRAAMLPAGDGGNLNGPCLLRVPAWCPHPLARYYLYFAHHNGAYIRLALADDLHGPWRVHPPGTLHLRDVPTCKWHIASPDVIVDDATRQFRMYFHGPALGQPTQTTFLAVSDDGLHFVPRPEPLGLFYWRVWRHAGTRYAMAKGGQLYRSPDGLTGWTRGPNPFATPDPADPQYNKPGSLRHVAVDLQGDALLVYFTKIGDAPEAILRARVPLTGDWETWRAGPAELVLRPEHDYEGANVPLAASTGGSAKGRQNAVRDPHVYVEDGRRYLVYAAAGEESLAMAEVIDQ